MQLGRSTTHLADRHDRQRRGCVSTTKTQTNPRRAHPSTAPCTPPPALIGTGGSPPHVPSERRSSHRPSRYAVGLCRGRFGGGGGATAASVSPPPLPTPVPSHPPPLPVPPPPSSPLPPPPRLLAAASPPRLFLFSLSSPPLVPLVPPHSDRLPSLPSRPYRHPPPAPLHPPPPTVAMVSPAFVGAAAVSSSAFVARRSALSARPSAVSVARISRRSALRMADEEEVRIFLGGGRMWRGCGGARRLCVGGVGGREWRWRSMGVAAPAGLTIWGGEGLVRRGCLRPVPRQPVWSSSVRMKQRGGALLGTV